MDPMFRQRLRQHYRDLLDQMAAVEVGSRAWFAFDKALRSTDGLYLELFREPVIRVHSAGEGRSEKDPPLR